jgi:hypothetical protein
MIIPVTSLVNTMVTAAGGENLGQLADIRDAGVVGVSQIPGQAA